MLTAANIHTNPGGALLFGQVSYHAVRKSVVGNLLLVLSKKLLQLFVVFFHFYADMQSKFLFCLLLQMMSQLCFAGRNIGF